MGLLDILTVPGGPLGVNTYVVGAEGGAECLVIDPGAEVYRVEKAVQGRKVTAVLLTHAHFDHMLYAQPWLDQGARLYVHADDAAALSDPSLNLSTMVNCRLALPEADVLLAEGDGFHQKYHISCKYTNCLETFFVHCRFSWLSAMYKVPVLAGSNRHI